MKPTGHVTVRLPAPNINVVDLDLCFWGATAKSCFLFHYPRALCLVLVAVGAMIGKRSWQVKAHQFDKSRSHTAVQPVAIPALDMFTAPLLLMACAMMYGGNVPILKSLHLEGAPALPLLILRFALASAAILPYVAMKLHKTRLVLRQAVELSMYLAVGYVFQILALERASASVTSVCFACTGAMVQMIEFIADGKVLSPVVATCSLITLMGVALFDSGDHSSRITISLESKRESMAPRPTFPTAAHDLCRQEARGELMALLATLSFAVHTWRSGKLVAASGENTLGSSSDAMMLAALQCPLTLIFCFVFISLTNVCRPKSVFLDMPSLDISGWLQISVCGVICTGLPMILELFAFKLVPPCVASLIYCTIPVWGLSFAVIFLGEAYGPASVVASLIILVSSTGPSLLQVLGRKFDSAKL